MKLHILAASVLAAGLSTAAQATISVKIYTDQPAAAADATLAQANSLVPDATVNVGAINFTDAPGNDSEHFTVGAFLNNPAGLDPTVAIATLNNTYFLFSGSTFLHAGDNSFVIPHDDGLQLDIAGVGLVVDQPGPTSPENTPFNVIASTSGLHAFQLSYGETRGGPAVLAFQVNGAPVGGVPEPASWAMLLTGFAFVGYRMRRREHATVAA